MKEMFEKFQLGELSLANRFIFPPIKTAYGTPKGNVTDRHLTYYRQIAKNGPGLEIAEKLGKMGFDVVATKRSDPIGSMMEMITKKLTLMRIGQMPNVTLMPHTTVKKFGARSVEMEKEGEKISLEPFQTVVLASGMLSAPKPDAAITQAVPNVETIGDARNVMDIYTAVHTGYELALKY